LAEYPWPGQPRTIDDLIGWLAGEGVSRIVLSHGGARPDGKLLTRLAAHDVELQLAGGVTDARLLAEIAETGVKAVILGEALLNGSIDFTTAREEARGTVTGGTTR
jgi:hypothetical protein